MEFHPFVSLSGYVVIDGTVGLAFHYAEGSLRSSSIELCLVTLASFDFQSEVSRLVSFLFLPLGIAKQQGQDCRGEVRIRAANSGLLLRK